MFLDALAVKFHAKITFCKHLDQICLQHIFVMWRLVAQMLGLGLYEKKLAEGDEEAI